MLTTLLENQVKGGKWHALIAKVYAPLNLHTAARKVTGKQKAAGIRTNPKRISRTDRWPNAYFAKVGL